MSGFKFEMEKMSEASASLGSTFMLKKDILQRGKIK